MITKEILQQTGKKKGLNNKEHIEKDYFQDLLLFNIYKKTNLLVFKGGTALYKFYGLQRFSEDLDFSLIKETTDIEKIISEAVNNIEGATIKDIKKTKNSMLIKVGFKGIITIYNTVRIDINLKNDILEQFDVKTYVSGYIDINPFSARVLSLKEIVSEKVHALFAREKARDLYDLFFLLKFVEFDKSLIEKKLALFDMNFDYKKLTRRINDLKSLWKGELESFVLTELPDFEIVRGFVLKNLNKGK